MPIKPSMKLVPLALGGLVVTLVILFLAVYILRAWWSIPLFGFGAGGEDQPIAFSHVIHVQENDIACEFCHRNVSKGQAATVPAVEQCLFCHKTIADSANPELAKLMGYVELGPQGEVVSLQPIDWEKVHRLPDHVQFVHEAHVRYFTQGGGVSQATAKGVEEGFFAAGQEPTETQLLEATCSICHGKIRDMEKVKQVRALKMGDCVDCHRDLNAPTDCTTCHY